MTNYQFQQRADEIIKELNTNIMTNYVSQTAEKNELSPLVKTIGIAALIGAGLIAAIMALVHLLGGGPTWRVSNIDSNIIAVYPSIVRMADLCAGPVSWIFIILGGLITGFGIASGITDTNIGRNHKADTGIKIALTLAGLVIVLTVYFLPADNARDWVHTTLASREEAKAITNKHFTSKKHVDPNRELYDNSFANPR